MKKIKTSTDEANLAKLSSFLLKHKQNKKLRYRHLSRNAGIARCTISKIINGKSDVTFTTLVKLAESMGLQIDITERKK